MAFPAVRLAPLLAIVREFEAFRSAFRLLSHSARLDGDVSKRSRHGSIHIESNSGFTLCSSPKIKRDVKLTTQLRESARSAPSNIAEGFGRFGNKEFARFARMSKGSLHESLNHLIDARDQQMITGDELLIEEHHIRKAIRAVTGLIRHLETTKEPERKEPERKEPRTKNPSEPDP